MKIILKIVRNGLGIIVVFINWLTKPKPIKRIEADQNQAQATVSSLALYQLYACPFCVKVRRAIHRLNVDIEVRNINTPKYREELQTQGGRVKAPCLRIEESGEVSWLYESSDIIRFLEDKLGVSNEEKLPA